jgi:hypothetical protein
MTFSSGGNLLVPSIVIDNVRKSNKREITTVFSSSIRYAGIDVM